VLDAEAETRGRNLGGGGGILGCAMASPQLDNEPFGSSETLKPLGTPLVVAGMVGARHG